MTTKVRLPNNWQPRPYQRRLWNYLENGGTRAVEVAHRRWGKDEVALHWTAVAGQQKVGTYWHLLPQASQARKAIWEAINPHTGLRRIDEAFPPEIRETTLNNEMFIRFKNKSTWQVVGSDNFNSLVGSPPLGLVLSEYSLSNPVAWSILRPILLENGGWAVFLYTPRGPNHGKDLLEAAQVSPRWFAEVSTVAQTKAIDADLLEEERAEMRRENGHEMGDALFMQEWMCSFEAAIIGAFYGSEMRAAKTEGRVTDVPWQPDAPVYTAWDIGRSDDTSIWWFQIIGPEIHVIDFWSAAGSNPDDVAELLLSKPYRYEKHFLPHDARAKTFASDRSTIELLAKHLGIAKMAIVPDIGVQGGIQAVRLTLPKCYFDAIKCKAGIEALTQYQREYDQDKKAFRLSPLHNWASDPADAFRMLAVAWQPVPDKPKADPDRLLLVGAENQATLDDMWAAHRPARGGRL